MADPIKWNDTVLPPTVKWREATYHLIAVEDGKVSWVNNYSRYIGSCSVESWLKADPYDSANR